ncbi:MAG: hypothetical protein AUK37_02400 [Rhodobacterales bacterium CG2_30_65_12]|nr:MAG: hypothetical protein AUK37_02400 [Rhodobacterales bacterium CG2_30_65_12]
MPRGAQNKDLAGVEAAINEVRFDFIRRLEGYVEQLDGILEALIAASAPAAGIEEAAHISHRIAGVASIFGYTELGRIAQYTDTAISAFLSNEEGEVDIVALTEKISILADFSADVCGELSHQGFRNHAV